MSAHQAGEDLRELLREQKTASAAAIAERDALIAQLKSGLPTRDAANAQPMEAEDATLQNKTNKKETRAASPPAPLIFVREAPVHADLEPDATPGSNAGADFELQSRLQTRISASTAAAIAGRPDDPLI